MKTVGLTRFVLRQTKSEFVGTKIQEKDLGRLAHLVQCQLATGEDVQDGYAPFCKVVVIDNTDLFDVKASYVGVDEAMENEREVLNSPYSLGGGTLKEAGYESRRPEEPAMPVTPSIRWYGDLPRAKYLHVVIYSREQLQAEGDDFSGADWDVVSVNAEMQKDKGAPMTPSTMIRNHLGKEWGGSGQPIDMKKYNESVEFWSCHYLVD